MKYLCFSFAFVQTMHPGKVSEYAAYRKAQYQESHSRKREHTENLEASSAVKKSRKHATQLTLIGSKSSGTKSVTVAQSRVNELILQYIVSEFLPLRTVEKQSFKNLVTGLSPTSTVMCRLTLTKKLDEKSELVLKRVREEINASAAVCTTADIWSCLKKSYMGVTAHWINDDLKRVSVALACRRFRGSHTAEAIVDQLVNIHSDFGLDHRKIAFTVTDNGSNFVKAFAEFQCDEDNKGEGIVVDTDDEDSEQMESNQAIMDDEGTLLVIDVEKILLETASQMKDSYLPKHMRCASHTFNLIATSDVSHIIKNNCGSYKGLYRSAMAKCSRLWTNVSRSTKSSDIVESIVKVSLRAPGETRWNSTYDAIKRLLDERVRDKLSQIMDALKMARFKPIEIEILNEYLKVMSPIATALDKLQGEDHCFIGLLMPTVQQVRKKLLDMSTAHSGALIDGLVDSINRRFSYLFEYNSTSSVYAIAAVAHPNFKLRWVTADKKEWVKNAFIAEAKKYSHLPPRQNTTQDALCSGDTFFDFEDDTSEHANRIQGSEIEIECLRYLEDSYSASIDVLQRYPAVKTVFQKLNATVPSSAPVERLFSKGSLISVPRRNRLGDKRFEQLLLLQANGCLFDTS